MRTDQSLSEVEILSLRKLAALTAALCLLFGSAVAQEAENIVGQCAFQVSEGSTEKITDTSISTGWVPEGANPEMIMRLPESGARWFQINWTKAATNFEILQYDGEKNLLSSCGPTQEDSGFLANLYEVTPGARYVAVRFAQPGQGINKIRVFGDGMLPDTVVRWQPQHDNCDLMVISTHMDDEWLWFGGIIPYYDVIQQRNVQVVYMADCGRLRHAEALNALAKAGVRTYPVFLDLKDERIDSLQKTLEHWGGQERLTERMVALIRRFRPEVILTHDWNGEYGHNQHILTSRCMEYVIAAAADPSQYPDTAAEYGAWQVRKLYRHLEKKCPIEFDWHVSYPELGGRTLLETAADSMNENASQTKYYQVKDHGQYDNAKFGLSYSTVGDDVEHKDLFENIVFETPTPEPTAEPTPTPEPVPTPAEEQQTAGAAAVPEPSAERGRGSGWKIVLFAALACGACALAVAAVLGGKKKRRKRKHKKRRRARR